MPNFQPVNSSHVGAVAYEGDELHVQFNDGSVHAYKAPECAYWAMMNSPSPGSYLRRNVIGKHESRKVSDGSGKSD